MRDLYCKPFVFTATRYEEYRDGICLGKGGVSVQIISKVVDTGTKFHLEKDLPSGVMFHLEGNLPTNIKKDFGIPVFGIESGDILEDRIQYGRFPDNFTWKDPTDPVICNIFANKTCIRFAMMNPLRIVEFFGNFETIG